MFTNKDLKNLIAPLFLEQLLVLLVGIADTFIVSYAGEAAVSGVSLVNSFSTIFIYLFTTLASGGAVVISQYIGRGAMCSTQWPSPCPGRSPTACGRRGTCALPCWSPLSPCGSSGWASASSSAGRRWAWGLWGSGWPCTSTGLPGAPPSSGGTKAAAGRTAK